jgi:hypothetical protein
MTESDSGEAPHTSEVPESPSVSPTPGSHEPTSLGYGNIYTPHAGSMIIHVQRESGLQSRMIVLGPRRVRLLRFLFSRGGKISLAVACVIFSILVVEAARVPSLMHRVTRMEHTAGRLDSLERSLGQLQRRYDQVRAMMGADSNSVLGAATPQARSLTPLSAATPRLGAAVSPDVDSQGSATTPSAVADDGSNNLEGAPQSATTVANPSEPDPSAAPVHRRRRHPVVEPPKDSGTATPDSGADPSTQAEPQ